MKNPLRLLLLVLSCTLFQACPLLNNPDDIDFRDASNYEPVILNRTEFEDRFGLEISPRSIVNAGKIYTKDDFIFINEINQGFHIVDNTNPNNPVNIGFIVALGSSDLSIKGNVFYVNNAVDLIAFTINDSTSNITLTKRVKNTFLVSIRMCTFTKSSTIFA